MTLEEACAMLIAGLGRMKRTGYGWEEKEHFLEFYEGNARRPMLRGLNNVANNYVIRELCVGVCVYACEILTMRRREGLNALL